MHCVIVKRHNFQLHGTQTAGKHQTMPGMPLSSVVPEALSGQLGGLGPGVCVCFVFLPQPFTLLSLIMRVSTSHWLGLDRPTLQ